MINPSEFSDRPFHSLSPEIAVAGYIAEALADPKYASIRNPLIESAKTGAVGLAVTNRVPVAEFLEAMSKPSSPDRGTQIATALGRGHLSDIVVLHDLRTAQQAAKNLSYFDIAAEFDRAGQTANIMIAQSVEKSRDLMEDVLVASAPIDDREDQDIACIRRGTNLVTAMKNVLSGKNVETDTEPQISRNENPGWNGIPRYHTIGGPVWLVRPFC